MGREMAREWAEKPRPGGHGMIDFHRTAPTPRRPMFRYVARLLLPASLGMGLTSSCSRPAGDGVGENKRGFGKEGRNGG